MSEWKQMLLFINGSFVEEIMSYYSRTFVHVLFIVLQVVHHLNHNQFGFRLLSLWAAYRSPEVNILMIDGLSRTVPIGSSRKCTLAMDDE